MKESRDPRQRGHKETPRANSASFGVSASAVLALMQAGVLSERVGVALLAGTFVWTLVAAGLLTGTVSVGLEKRS